MHLFYYPCKECHELLHEYKYHSCAYTPDSVVIGQMLEVTVTQLYSFDIKLCYESDYVSLLLWVA